MSKQRIQMNIFSTQRFVGQKEFFRDQTVPLEKMLQVDPLTWIPSRGPHGASLEPEGKSNKKQYKSTKHVGIKITKVAVRINLCRIHMWDF